MRVVAVTSQAVAVSRATVGRRVVGVDVLIPLDPMTMPKSGGYTYYQRTPAATWSFEHPLGRVPQVSIYTLDDLEIDTDVESTPTTVTLTFSMPMTGYVVLT